MTPDENPSLRIRECAELRAEIARLRADRSEFKAWWDLTAKDLNAAREKLAEAKRLGLEACDAAQMSDDQMMWAPINVTAIRAALEAL